MKKRRLLNILNKFISFFSPPSLTIYPNHLHNSRNITEITHEKHPIDLTNAIGYVKVHIDPQLCSSLSKRV